MSFTSYSFIFIFLPLVIIGYFIFNHFNKYGLAKLLLLAFSLGFYFSFGWKGFTALLISTGVTYLIATFGFNEKINIKVRKLLLIFGIVLSVALLAYCKYLTYAESLINKYCGSNLIFTSVVQPVGISYFTFSMIAYLVDSYKDVNLKYSILDYTLFISFFPKITVGPIALSTEMIPQFNDLSLKKPDYDNLAKGFVRFTLGLSKKLILADNIGAFVDLGYFNNLSLGTTNALLVILGYTLQIYFDFSGYCDIAIGICQMLNIEMIDNFDAPYKAISIADFWKRWHISLTRFFRNYLYIPLGGNRKGKLRTYINTMIIFLVSGLWHGAATTFIVWGAIHGIGSIISKIISPVMEKVPKFFRWLLTFSFVNLAWVFFRSPDLDTAIIIFKQLFTGGFVPMNVNIVAACIPPEGQLFQWLILKYRSTWTNYSGCFVILALLFIALVMCTLVKTASEQVKNLKLTRLRLFTTVILFIWSVLSLSQVSEFIYVNF